MQLGIKDLDQKSNVASEKAVGLRHDSKKYFILCAALCSYDKTATKLSIEFEFQILKSMKSHWKTCHVSQMLMQLKMTWQ